MKTLHANKDYVLRDGHIDVLKPEYVNNASYSSLCLVASTDKSLPVKHIDRSLFVKPEINIEDYSSGYADKWDDDIDVYNGIRLAFIDGYENNQNQFTLEDMNNLWRLKGNETVNFDHAIESLRPLSLPEIIQCDDNYENLKPIWE